MLAISTKNSSKKDLLTSGKMQTIIGADTEFEGTIKTGGLRIDGTFKGTVEEAEYIVIGETGRLTGDVHARTMMIAGKMEGNTFISDTLEISPTGKLTGDVETNVFVMNEGSFFKGNCKMNLKEENTIDKNE